MKHKDTASRKSARVRRRVFLYEAKESGTQVRLMVLGAIIAMALLSGYASPHAQGNSDPWKYNPNTGYPALGGPRWIDS